MPTSHPLDDPVGESLRGRHAHLAVSVGQALRYREDVSTFVTVPDDPSPADWADLAQLLGPGGFADLFSSPATPSGWEQVFALTGTQLVFDQEPVPLKPDARVVRLRPADVPDMLALTELTHPGPFWTNTIAMGRYLGIRENGRLIAMAGERLAPPGWTEISAVCTAPDARGQGLAATLIQHAVHAIHADRRNAFLHVIDGNAARGLYDRLGFRARRNIRFHGYSVPDEQEMS